MRTSETLRVEFDPYVPLPDRSRSGVLKGTSLTRYFVVDGTGIFPTDMLRYDQAWAITSLGDPQDPCRRAVVLATRQPSGYQRPPTEDRWQSFGWKVIQRDVPFKEVRDIIGGSSKWNGHCQRCGKRTLVSTPSVFNNQILCLECSGEERKHPNYNMAQNELKSARKRKDTTFLGIGWRP